MQLQTGQNGGHAKVHHVSVTFRVCTLCLLSCGKGPSSKACSEAYTRIIRGVLQRTCTMYTVNLYIMLCLLSAFTAGCPQILLFMTGMQPGLHLGLQPGLLGLPGLQPGLHQHHKGSTASHSCTVGLRCNPTVQNCDAALHLWC